MWKFVNYILMILHTEKTDIKIIVIYSGLHSQLLRNIRKEETSILYVHVFFSNLFCMSAVLHINNNICGKVM